MTSETAAKKDTQKLQRAIVDGLEDVKAQDIEVFNTEHLSPLFERVIIASGTSNRQTKALAARVRDAVREAGFPKPRIEGEENGEWIIVDCGAAVAHIMQPTIRQYYHLEEIWGDKPVRLKFGAAKPVVPEPVKPAKKATAKKAPAEGVSLRRSSAAKTAIKAAEQAAKAEKEAAARSSRSSSRRPAAKKAASAAPAAKPLGKPVVKVVGKPTPRPAAKTAVKPAAKTAAKAPARSAARPAAKPAAKAPAKKAPARKA